MPAIRLGWFGSPRLEVDGKTVRLETRKALALVAYLTVCRQSHGREFLSNLFWPDYRENRAQANLRQCILCIKQALGPSFLASCRDRIGIADSPNLWMDTAAFAGFEDAVETHVHENGILCEDCIRSLECAIDIPRGDFLEGFNLRDCPDFDMWQQSHRDDLTQRLSVAFKRLVAAYINGQDWERAIGYSLRWLRIDRCNEAAHRTLMLLYYHAGRKRAATDQYRECVNHLRDELGVSPERTTTELFDQIRLGRLNEQKVATVPPRQPSHKKREIDPFLVQKLSIPCLQHDLVARPRLRLALENGLQTPFTLISAPAGFGKTTMLAEWAHQLREDGSTAVSWLSIDQSDNDPARFLLNLSSSIDTANAASPDREFSFLQAMPASSTRNTVQRLVRDLQKKNQPAVIILDDFSFVTNTHIHVALRELIEHLPQSAHLYLSTRSDPTRLISPLRSKKAIVEVRADDLRFTSEEVESFLNKLKKLNLTRAELYSLEYKTEGWIVGLQVAAHSVSSKEPHSSFIRSFGGSHKQIVDYLVEEVLSVQDHSLRDFLLKTACLDRMNDSLCRAMTGLDECQSILEKLESSNLFIVPLDTKREWYRYHHLFREALEFRQQQHLSEANMRRLHLTAAKWYKSRDLLDEAIQQALIARDFAFAARLLAKVLLRKIAQGELNTLLSWIDAIPDDTVFSDPQLCVAKSWALLLSGLTSRGERFLNRARDGLSRVKRESERVQIRSHVAALSAFIAEVRDEGKRAIDLAIKASELLGESDGILRGIILFLLGRLYRKQGDLAAAAEAFAKITELGKTVSSEWMQAIGVCDTATIRQMQGRLSEAAELCRLFLLQKTGSCDLKHGSSARVFFRFADILYEKNKLNEARRHISIGLDSMQEWPNPNDLAFGNIELMRLHLAQKNDAGFKNTLKRAEELQSKFDLHSHLRSWITICRIRFESASGHHIDALRHAKALLAGESEGPLLREFELIEYCRVLICCARKTTGEPYINLAIEMLARMAKKAKAGKRLHRYVQILNLHAIAKDLVGRTPEALALLKEALLIAEPEGYSRTFLDEGKPLEHLLKVGKSDNLWGTSALSQFVGSLLRRLS